MVFLKKKKSSRFFVHRAPRKSKEKLRFWLQWLRGERGPGLATNLLIFLAVFLLLILVLNFLVSWQNKSFRELFKDKLGSPFGNALQRIRQKEIRRDLLESYEDELLIYPE